MRPFTFSRAMDVNDATRRGANGAHLIAGGTNLVDLMKYDVVQPQSLIDVNRLDLHGISEIENGGLRLGALVTNARTAYDARVRRRYPVLSDAILSGASAQLRNAATNGGNLNQRTRCYYFYNTATACNKRDPGSGCAAIGGVTRVHGILGTSNACIATHPSDMCVALAALEAVVQVSGQEGQRSIPFADYHRLPGSEPWSDNDLQPGDVLSAIDLPREVSAHNYTYLKVRDRQSYAFALVSAAVVMDLKEGRIVTARVALGGVAHKPWRVPSAERMLYGQAPGEALFRKIADAILEGAQAFGGNDFKIELARKVIVRACGQAAAGTPQPVAEKDFA